MTGRDGSEAAATIYDVAQLAGVSISTVSNTLNRPDRVSQVTRSKVLSAADSLGFVPKVQATVLASKGVKRIGVLAPFSSADSYFRRLDGVLGEAAGRGQEVVVFDLESAAASLNPVLASIPARGRVDGLIVMGHSLDDDLESRLLSRGLTTVVVDAASDRLSSVGTDDVAAGRIAAEHLLRLGHTRLGFVTQEQISPYSSAALKRLEGFGAVVEAAGGSVVSARCDGTMDGAIAAARRLLEAEDRPTAIAAHHDRLAVGVLRAATLLGLDIPKDVSVMGFDDGPVAEAVGLTSVRVPFEESGRIAARLLRDLLAEGPSLRRVVLSCELRVRTTTAPAPL